MYQVIEKDPRVLFELKPDRAATIDRQISEVVFAMPAELVEEKRNALKALAVTVLKSYHEKKMAGRLAQWRTTCRLDGCEKQPRTGRNQSGHKAHRRNHVFCVGHAGVKNLISKRDYVRLQNNANLRVVAR